MKDKILIVHPVFGIITFKDIINDLEIILADNELFEELVYQTLKNTKLNDEDISTYFNFSVTNRLKWIIDVLKSML